MTITTDQVYLLNNKMGPVARNVQLGTLIQNAESVTAGEIALADGKLLIGGASGVGAAQTISGDLTISNAGVAAIASGVIVNADVNASAAIDFSKLAALTDTYILVGSGSNVATAVAVSGDVSMANNGAVTIAANAVESSMVSDTAGAVKTRRYSIAYTDLTGAGTGVAFTTGTALPDNAIITRSWYEVTTTFAGDGDDSSTIKIGLEDQDNDVVAAVAIKTGTDWDEGFHEGIQDGTAAAFIKTTTATRQLAVTWTAVATDTTLTAGAMDVFVEYVVGQ